MDDKLYLIHIIESIDKIDSYLVKLDYDSFMNSSIVQDAVLHNLQVLAESTQRLSDEFKGKHPEIEWYKIAGLRNVLVHDYLGIDLEMLWATVTNQLSDLGIVVKDAIE